MAPEFQSRVSSSKSVAFFYYHNDNCTAMNSIQHFTHCLQKVTIVKYTQIIPNNKGLIFKVKH